MRHKVTSLCIALLVCSVCSLSFGQKFVPNYDEAKVPKYKLPNPFVMTDNVTVVETAEQWMSMRRPDLLALFKKEMFGQMPGVDRKKIKFEEIESSDNALGGKAIRKQIRIYFNAPNKTPKADMLVYIPKGKAGPVPAILGLNFSGNHTLTAEKEIVDPGALDGSRYKAAARKDIRGSKASRWPVEKIIGRGYALATIYYEEIAPDSKDSFKTAAFTTFDKKYTESKEGDVPCAITTWAWGLSRALDALGTIPAINAKKVIVFGHSRLGKTALWASACDSRFAAAISNNSGCCGAALSRRDYGETVGSITVMAPHWSCDNFKKYAKDLNSMPFDQHELIALTAPRPIYIASAEEDKWADPKGEFLAAKKADPVYRLNRTGGFGDVGRWQPPINTSVGDIIRYHIRTGKHDVTDFDWEQYLNFGDQYVR